MDTNGNGVPTKWIVSVVSLIIVTAISISFITSILWGQSVASASSFLERNGYTVLLTAEYDIINTKLDALKVSADAAVVNAEAAALAAQETLDTLLLHNENEMFLYPESVGDTVTFTAGGVIDTFGAWAEIVDNHAVSLSAEFAADAGYLVEITARNYSVANELYIIELATANDGTNIIGRVKVRSDWTYVLALRSVRIEAGDTIYYRMKAETAGATLLADFRFYYD